MNSTTTSSTPVGTRLPRLWAGFADDLQERRRARAAHTKLRRELSTYNTPADVEDLLGLLHDHDDSAADEIRTILFDNLAQPRQSGRRAS